MSIVVVDAVTVQYAGGQSVGPFSFSAGPGVTHLTGPNGAGKSTLLGVIATAIRQASGRVTVDGCEPDTDASARAKLGYVPTTPLLPGFLTVEECWRMMAKMRNRPDWEGHRLCEQLDLPGEVRLDRASTGMRRKASLVAALAGDPPVLLVDETLANLDVQSVPVAIALLEATRRTVILTHHGPLPPGLEGAVEVSLRGTDRSGS